MTQSQTHSSHASPTSAAQIGIVGAGQLARMTLEAATPLGITVQLLAAHADDGAALISPNVHLGSPTSLKGLSALAGACDVLTFDHELVDVEQLRQLERAGHHLRPSAATVAIAQNKRRQRATFAELGLPAPPHRPVSAEADLLSFGEEHGWPLVAKASRGGYDGRGVWVVQSPTEARELYARTSAAGVQLLAESWVPIERELAVLVARRPNGEAITYPVVETVQVEGICHEIVAPAPIAPRLTAQARELAMTIAEAIGATGMLAVELFVANDALLINEIAARPHNSGHFSIEGCVTSQFENHLRAILDWPLGSTALTAPAVVTVNVLGTPTTRDPARSIPEALALEGVHIHLYQKAARPGRKLGHVTALGDNPAEVLARARKAAALIAA